ncbi:MAG TPA: DMT family transporter [Pyrinomonadaceae bacterium]|jgi:drug/metabolite transporter (DMT)-like permease
MEAEIETGQAASRKQISAEEAHATQAYLSMLWGALAFASMGALGHLAGERCSWQLVAVARTSLALIFSVAFALVSGVRLVFFKPATLWLRSLFGSIGLLCSFYALTHLPISTSLTLSSTVPIWVALLAWLLLGYRPTTQIWFAIAAAIIGVVLIQKPYLAGGNLAGLAALTHALCWAIGMIGLNRLSHIDPRAVVTHFAIVSTFVALIFFVLTGADINLGQPAGKALMAMLVGVGLTGTLGQLGMTRAFAIGHPSKVAVVGLMQIVFACFFDLIIWRHHFDALTICGILLVMAPTAWLLLHSPLRRNDSIHNTV